MAKEHAVGPIPYDEAMSICERIREGNKGHRFTFSAMRCGGCIKFSKGDVKKMCFSNAEGNRGCNLVNKEYEKRNDMRA